MSYSTSVEVRELNVHRIRRHDRIHVLKNLTFSLDYGSITGLLGPSGCGKTTLLRTLVGAQRFDGSVKILGRRPGARQIRGKVGYVTQAPTTYEDLTVKENLDYFAALCGEKADLSVLDSFFLREYENILCGRLSGGQRNRLSLACALVGKPEILFLDEPTVGLDPLMREKLWAEFKHLSSERKTSILISSHVLDEAARCDDLLVMREGVFIWRGKPNQMLHETDATSYDDAFLRIVSQGGKQK